MHLRNTKIIGFKITLLVVFQQIRERKGERTRSVCFSILSRPNSKPWPLPHAEVAPLLQVYLKFHFFLESKVRRNTTENANRIAIQVAGTMLKENEVSRKASGKRDMAADQDLFC